MSLWVLLEKQLVKELNERSVKSFIDILILAELENGPICGYDVVAFTADKSGVVVNTGMIYSALRWLALDKLTKSRFDKTKRYTR
jgi:DNA-binding PadR family transcriptional regulator